MTESLSDQKAAAFPEGYEWRCTACGNKYPPGYDPITCECGSYLMRVILSFPLGDTINLPKP